MLLGSSREQSKAEIENPSSSKSNKKPNPCTPGHCSHCHLSPNKHCTRCTNGYLIDKSSQPSCTVKSKIKNCRKGGSLDEPSNANICRECQRGFRLVDSQCVKDGEIHGCSDPFWHQDQILCLGCEGMFLKSDYSGCISTLRTKTKFPANCLYGGREDAGGCLMCERGYDLTGDAMNCVRSKVDGCKEFKDADHYFCLQCDTTRGYFAVDVKQIGSDFHQICKLFSQSLKIHTVIFFCLIFLTNFHV